MQTELTKLLSTIRDTLDTCERMNVDDASERAALQALHKLCGTWQQRIHYVLNPPQTANADQVADANRSNKQFTLDQRVVDFCHSKKIVLNPKEQWYWCRDQHHKDGSPAYGHITGIEARNGEPRLRGVARITDGVLIWVEREDGTMFQGHRDWFKVERKVEVNGERARKKAKVDAKEARRNDVLKANVLAMLTGQ
jgi:hypothetical protein